MISISPIRINNSTPIKPNPPRLHQNGNTFRAGVSAQAENYKEQGNEYLKTNELDSAIECYKKAIGLAPQYTDAHFNLGKAYVLKKDYAQAVKALETASKLNPKDTEIISTLGESYKNNGQYPMAIKTFEQALALDPYSDYTKRNLAETQNLQLAVWQPKTAYEQRKAQAQKNLNDAINIAKNHMPKGYTNDMGDVSIVFDSTDTMGGRSNIAQYEHSKRKITVTEDFVRANPNLVSAYLVHEFIHAKDNDPYTSVHEEQDAYEVAAKFWLGFTKTAKPPVKDPEMDYVIELYKDSPQRLRDRVSEIYRLRDPGIAMTSPNHPPKSSHAASGLTETAAAQKMKHYDVIA